MKKKILGEPGKRERSYCRKTKRVEMCQRREPRGGTRGKRVRGGGCEQEEVRGRLGARGQELVGRVGKLGGWENGRRKRFVIG